MADGVRRFVHVLILALTLVTLAAPIADFASAQDATPPAEETEVAVQTEETTPEPTEAPVEVTVVETEPPTQEPTLEPTSTPSPEPTAKATKEPTAKPTKEPTKKSEPQLAVVSPAIALSKTKGAVGTAIVVTLSGFPGSKTIAINWDGSKLASVKTDSAGKATVDVKAPAAVAGKHTVEATVSGANKSASFTITPRISLSPNNGGPGSAVKVSLSGYGKSEKVDLIWGGTKLKTVSANSTGAWSGSITVAKDAKSGEVRVEGKGAAGNKSPTTFVVRATSASPTPTKTPTAPAGPTGSLAVTVRDVDGAAIPGACFTVFKQQSGARGKSLGTACDDADGKDGVTTLTKIEAGSVIVSQSTAPDDYLPAADATVTVTANQTKAVEVVNKPNSGLTVIMSDEFGASLPGSCFSLYTDIGSGKLGTLAGSACDDADDQNDGVIGLGFFQAGKYVLVEKVIPRGYARTANKTFTLTDNQSRAVPIANEPGGAVVVTKVNEFGDPVMGACFDAYIDLGGNTLGNFVDRSCNDAGNTVVISGLPVGNYYLVESKAPVGYAAGPNKQFSIQAKKDTSVTIPNQPTTKLIVRKQNEKNQPLKGACFEIYKVGSNGARGARLAGPICDDDDGKDDGYLTYKLSPGNYLLAESKAPKGYMQGNDIAFKIKSGADTAIDVPNVLGGKVKVTNIDSIDEWIRPTGACFTVWGHVSGSNRPKLGSACDSDDGKKDGITTVVGLPTGSWTLEQTKVPWGYFSSPAIPVDVVLGETTEVDFYNEPWPLLIIHKVDEYGEPLGGACFTAFVDLGGGQRGAEWGGPDGPLCDTNGDGTLYALVTPGNQILVEKKAPEGYLPVGDTPFVMIRGQVTELTIANYKVGTIRVTKTDMDGKKLTGACFEAYRDANGKRGAKVASGCDRETSAGTYNKTLDGITVLSGLTPGKYWLVEKTAPKGYFTAPDVLVTVTASVKEVTVKDEKWPELTITKIDDTGAPLKGACFQLYANSNGKRGLPIGGQVCGTLNNVIKIGGAPGTYFLVETKTPEGYVTMKDLSVTFTRGKNQEMEIVNQPAGFVKVTNLNESDKPLAGACWELWTDVSGSAGKEIERACSSSTSTTGRVTLTAPPGKYILKQDVVPVGYQRAAEVKVTVVARQTAELTIKNVPYPRLVINSVDAANKPLTGACFDIYLDGGTKLGAKKVTNLCDKTDGPNDGTTTRRLEPGRYVARQVTPPSGYAKAPDFKFTIAANTDLVLTLQHQIAGVLSVTTQDRAGLILKDACYELWTKTTAGGKGVLVAKACDKDSTSLTAKSDGVTTLSALPPGNYILSESFAPNGYVKAGDRTVTVVGGQKTPTTIVNDKK